MKTEKAIEFLKRYGNDDLELSNDEVNDIIELLKQGEVCKKFLDSLTWNTIYEAGKIYLEARVKYWDIEKSKNKLDKINQV